MAENRARIEENLSALQRKAGGLQSGDLTTLVALLPEAQYLKTEPDVPGALRTQAQRLESLIENAVMGEVEFSAAQSKINEAIAKMQRGFGCAPEAVVQANPPEVPADVVPMDQDLLSKFVSNQMAQMEDLEVWALESEKGNTAALELVRRYLHTLKGEFGVLDLGGWAAFIHKVEDVAAAGRLQGEQLLHLKDFLNARLPMLLQGMLQPPPQSEMDALLGLAEADAPQDGQEPAADPDLVIDDPDHATQKAPGRTTFAADPTFLADFIAESSEHIHTIEVSLLRLEANPGEEESLNQVFRACHTIKGLAGFLELHEIKDLSHSVEALMDRARRKQMELRPEHVDVLLAATDCVKEMVQGVQASMEGKSQPLPANLGEVMRSLRLPDSIAPPPPPPSSKAGRKVGELLVDSGVATAQVVESALALQKQGDGRPLGEILMADGQVSARDVGQALGEQIQARRMQSVEETVRVPVQRLDTLIDAIGEAVIAQSMVYADPQIMAVHDLALEKKMAQAALMMRQIQELSMSLRMVSIRATFQKMARLVRDLAKKLGKDVELVTAGEDTELDKSVVENIGDPLIHMVRNSLDHGIEMPADRAAAGKSVHGRLQLRAYHKAGNVHIEIEDDGKGLDRDAILAKAVASGKVKADARLSDSEIYHLVFLPGLSTAKTVTDVSGRGVGMDVVHRNIESLRGSVDIRSEKGKGTCFTIRLPLTLAIIQGMVIRVGQERFIVPTLSIVTTLRPEAGQISTLVGRGEILELRGELIRLIRLETVFRIPMEQKRRPIHECVVLVVEDSAGHKSGIVVDEILDQQQVVIKSLGSGMSDIQGVTGAAIMNDGSVSLILDVSGIGKCADQSSEEDA